MMRQHLLHLQSVVRQLQHSASLNVKSLLHPHRLLHSTTACSSYQLFDQPKPRGRSARNLVHPQQLPQPISHRILSRPLRLTRCQSIRSLSTTSSPSCAAKCWSCSRLPPASASPSQPPPIFCASCGIIQTVPEDSAANYFALFGLPPTFGLDPERLTRQFRQLQSLCHPDKFSQRSEREQLLSADWSSLVNAAYRTLLAPIRRGEYILRQHGLEVPEGNTAVASAFLMEMMERNEEVDDAQAGDELRELLVKVRADLARVVAKLDGSLVAGDLSGALEDVVELRYLVSLESSIKAKGQRLGVVV